MTTDLGLSGLFIAAFLAATPIPFQSEIVFVGLLASGAATPSWLILTASVGNTLGSFATYAIGRGIGGLRAKRWFPLTPAQMARAEGWFQTWGLWVLLLSWAPFGDVIVAMAGVLRVPVWQFALLVAVAKTARYVVLAAVTVGGMQVFAATP